LLVSKSKDINLFRQSEKISLIRFLALYTVLVASLLLLISLFYYQSQEKLMYAQYNKLLGTYATLEVKKLKNLHHYFPTQTRYPRSTKFKSGIYDNEESRIFSLLEKEPKYFESKIYRTEGKIHLVYVLETYYLGAKYLIIEVDEDNTWLQNTLQYILILGATAFLILSIFGFFFVKLFLKPMKDAMLLLDDFIKDTTHELNTPISAILNNVEMIDTTNMSEKNKKRLNRIDIASKSVSLLYQDLTYFALGHKIPKKDEEINLKMLILNRMEYFFAIGNSKHIEFILNLEEVYLFIDNAKITRVIDNLVSNAIKYNKRNGTITIDLTPMGFCVSDSGIGIEKEKIESMFDRYSRFNNTEGGFGIGLHLVKSIIVEYGFAIKVQSTLNVGTQIYVDFRSKAYKIATKKEETK